jgi:hypothetical protein
MLHIRKSINIVDSYQNDIGTPDAVELETNINLDFAGFEKENAQLTAQYHLSKWSATVALIKHYSAGSNINNDLIRVGGDPAELGYVEQREYNALIGLGGRVELAEPHHVYSGTGTFDPRDVTVEGIFKTPAFMSTSLSIKVAVKTTNYRRKEDEDHVLHFTLPAGFSDGFYIAPYSHDPEELEFLILANISFKYLGTKIVDLDGVTRHFHSYRPLTSG